jgi:hypothetical protein
VPWHWRRRRRWIRGWQPISERVNRPWMVATQVLMSSKRDSQKPATAANPVATRSVPGQTPPPPHAPVTYSSIQKPRALRLRQGQAGALLVASPGAHAPPPASCHAMPPAGEPAPRTSTPPGHRPRPLLGTARPRRHTAAARLPPARSPLDGAACCWAPGRGPCARVPSIPRLVGMQRPWHRRPRADRDRSIPERSRPAQPCSAPDRQPPHPSLAAPMAVCARACISPGAAGTRAPAAAGRASRQRVCVQRDATGGAPVI